MKKKKTEETSNNTRINFSESPLHLETTVDAEMLKNVVLHSVATAFANIVFPVPEILSILSKNLKIYQADRRAKSPSMASKPPETSAGTL